ncbi:MAG: NAD(P)H-dependent oxidoreductase [SAR324 cluster bacterium]|nr:NAD(P)H-dependent oxidoreductase [SAR324 cluster bacterium]
MKILAFGASTSRTSINKALATCAAGLVAKSEVEVLDLNDYEMPLYNADREKELGPQALAQAFLEKIAASDAVVVSFAEHNGTYTAAYKNLFDWCSRLEKGVFQSKPMVFLSTSPGAAGAGSVLAQALASAPFFSADVRGSLSFPSFNDNFDIARGIITNDELKAKLMTELKKLG